MTGPADAVRAEALRADAPLLDAWLSYRDGVAAGRIRPFTVPGHKQNTGVIGDVVAGDIPLYGGLDTVKQTGGLLADAEGRAARLWGADWCRFSVGGSTHGNQALALAVGTPGSAAVVSRTLHRSMLIGLVLAGLSPIWVHPDLDPVTGLPGAVPVAAVRAALAAHPDACAVLLGDPSYVGTVGDVAGYADVAHAAEVPLVVDAAWAPHFGFHPGLPPHPLAAGADAAVISAHKALPACGQAAIVLARTTASGGMLDAGRLERSFEATHTTSPAGAIMASTDAARALLAADGEPLFGRLIATVARAREQLRAVPGLDVLDGPTVDPVKLVVLTAGTGAHGNVLEADLLAAGFPVEMADRDTIVAAVTLADPPGAVDALVDALAAAVGRHGGPPRAPSPAAAWTVRPEQAMTPREAFFAPAHTIPADRAAGRVCAELVAPYPPGIPVLAPGERVTAEAVAALRAAATDGSRIAYAADPTLATVQVVA